MERFGSGSVSIARYTVNPQNRPTPADPNFLATRPRTSSPPPDSIPPKLSHPTACKTARLSSAPIPFPQNAATSTNPPAETPEKRAPTRPHSSPGHYPPQSSVSDHCPAPHQPKASPSRPS